jgi:hypothetical protein
VFSPQQYCPVAASAFDASAVIQTLPSSANAAAIIASRRNHSPDVASLMVLPLQIDGVFSAKLT